MHDVNSPPTDVTVVSAPAGKAEIVVGVATRNHGTTVAPLVRAAQAGLVADFKDVPTQVVVVDAGGGSCFGSRVSTLRLETAA